MHPGIFFIVFLLLLSSCERPASRVSDTRIREWQESHNQHILKLAGEFKNEPWSPVPERDRPAFTQPDYYTYNPDFRFSGPIHLYPVQDSITISGSKEGDIRPAQNYGWFEFEYLGQTHRLKIIRLLPRKPGAEAHLFLGFWDTTSGETTYSGGRYIDLEADSSGTYLVDFNYAYNPFCAYSDRYSCAIPPLENRLPFALEAGEKKYKNHP